MIDAEIHALQPITGVIKDRYQRLTIRKNIFKGRNKPIITADTGDCKNDPDKMGINWQIRAATIEDAEGLRKSMEAAYAPYQERMGGERLPPMDVDYSTEIQNYPSWVVESEGNILGGLIMVFENENVSIANIAVDPGFQGKGIGGALMKFAESKAKEKNFSELHLTTHVLLKENLSLYRHSGWQETGRDNTRVFMKKNI